MPYKNIHFVKVKMELLEDHRFLFQLNDRQKGLYVLLLALAGKTNNKIFNDLTFIKGRLAMKDIEQSDLQTISNVFPKFLLDGDFWRFDNFNEEHNQIFGISQVYPKDTQRMEQKKKENKKRKEVSTDEFYEELKKNKAYQGLDLETELGKIDGWLLAHPNRKKTKKFVIGWLNRIEKPLTNGIKPVLPQAFPTGKYFDNG